jgi:hypothetical protein
MVDELETAYPEAAPYIQQAVEEHGEAWVLDNYYQELYPLGRLMDVPEKEELPFFHADEHDTMSDFASRTPSRHSCGQGLHPIMSPAQIPVPTGGISLSTTSKAGRSAWMSELRPTRIPPD